MTDPTALAELLRGSHGQVVVGLARLGANAVLDLLEKERLLSGRLDHDHQFLLTNLQEFEHVASIILSLILIVAL